MYILYMRKQATEYPSDCVKLNIPLVIRLLEYAREQSPSDEDLHWITERLTEHSKKHEVLTMEDYTTLVPDSRLVTVEVGPGQKVEVVPATE